MKPRLTIILLLMVLLPLGLLAWLGARIARYEEQETTRRFEELLQNRLADINVGITRFMESRERQMLEATQFGSGIGDSIEQISQTGQTSLKSRIRKTGSIEPGNQADQAILAEAIRERVRGNPFVRQIFWADARGVLIHPSPDGPKTASEEEFLQRTREIWLNGDLATLGEEYADLQQTRPSALGRVGTDSLQQSGGAPRQQAAVPQAFAQSPRVEQPVPAPGRQSGAGPQQASQANTALPTDAAFSPLRGRAVLRENTSRRARSGWYAWFWGKGINLIYWRLDARGHIWGAELDRSRLLADLIALLPDTPVAAAQATDGRIALVDSSGNTLYAWGAYEPRPDETPRASYPLKAPLAAWRLDYFVPGKMLAPSARVGAFVGMGSALLVAAAALIGLAFYFYRESSREIREAGQRVSFVNQVSHELKTPLTNIRMYAELLENALHGEDERSRKHAGIIVDESRRLGRLIGNILTFSRGQRGKLTVRRKEGCIDEAVDKVLEQFGPSLRAKGIAASFDRGAGAKACFDSDMLEQILGNLLSNVEKYAADGGMVKIATRREGNKAVITVADYGAGIPEKFREKIFRPFERLSNRLTDGVSGTGIGLTIARDLARRHGGDLELMPVEEGACFLVMLDVSAGPSGNKGSTE